MSVNRLHSWAVEQIDAEEPFVTFRPAPAGHVEPPIMNRVSVVMDLDQASTKKFMDMVRGVCGNPTEALALWEGQ